LHVKMVMHRALLVFLPTPEMTTRVTAALDAN
jgi:hypothetical protein